MSRQPSSGSAAMTDTVPEMMAGDSSGSELATSAGGTTTTLGRKTSTRSQPKSSAKRSRHTGPSKATAQEEEEEAECFLCQEPLDSLTRLWRGHPFHVRCFNAVRCALRQADTKEAKSTVIDNAKENPELFREIVRPLVAGAGQVRSVAARKSFQSKVVKSKSTFTVQQSEKGKLLLTKVRYKHFMQHWEGKADSDASREFDENLDMCSSENCDSDGEPRVAVKDNERHCAIDGKKSSRSEVKKQGGCDTGRASLSDRSRAGAGSGRSFGEGSGRAWSSTGQEPRSPDRADVRRLSPGSNSKQVKQATQVKPGYKKVTSQNGDASSDFEEELPAVSVSSGTSGRRATEKPPALTDGSARTVDFLKKKSDLKVTFGAFVSEASVPKSAPRNLLKEAIARAEKNDIKVPADMDDPNDVAKQMAAGMEGLQALLTQVDKVSAKGFDEFVSKIEHEKTEFIKLETQAKDLTEAMNFMYEEMRKVTRQGQLQRRYQVQKIGNTLCAGGFSKVLAKHVSVYLHTPKLDDSVAVKADGLVHDKVHLLGLDSELGAKIGDMIGRAVQQDILKEKAESLKDALSKKPKWSGAMTQIPLDSMELRVEAGHSDMHQDHRGACPWVACVRRCAFRYGPNEFPCPGIGAFVRALTLACWVLVMEIEPVLKFGISMPDLVAFLDSENGQQYLSSNAVVMTKLELGQIVWCPFGRVAIPVSWDEGGKDEATESCFLHIPYLQPQWQEELSQTTVNAIMEFNCKHLQKVATNPLWPSRAELFAERLNPPKTT